MTWDQGALSALLAVMIVVFASGRVRHDLVALGALLAAVALGLVPMDVAFDGFGHPAVITVACVLILSRGLQVSGAVDWLARRVLPDEARPTTMILGLSGLGALLSGFMNNAGALALLMPVALKGATRTELPAGRVLMPLAFGTILGGMVTLVGTPPNLIVSGIRRDWIGEGFTMFAFAPVGGAVALAGLLFVGFLGWRLVPKREPAGAKGFDAGAYLTEAEVPEDSPAVDMRLFEAEKALDAAGASVIGLVRRDVRLNAPGGGTRLRAGDVLLLEVEPDDLGEALASLSLNLSPAEEPDDVDEAEEAAEVERQARAEGDDATTDGEDADGAGRERKAQEAVAEAKRRAEAGDGKPDPDAEGARARSDETLAERAAGAEAVRDEFGAEEVAGDTRRGRALESLEIAEFVVAVGSPLIGRTARGLDLRARRRVNLLALSREGGRRVGRLGATEFRAGDVLLLQGAEGALAEFGNDLRCLPLAEREVSLPDRRRMLLAVGVLGLAVAAAATGVAQPAVAFAAGVLAAAATGVTPPRQLYDAVDWPVIVLLACLLPVAGAMQDTGAAALAAETLVGALGEGSPILALALMLVLTMTLSAVLNNAATVAVMAPIALTSADALGSNPDTFLMAVAIGGSCAFLTPIGHQNNTLILGPGGFRFGDYWPLGLPMEVLVLAVSVPMLVFVWGI
ncbi:MAG: SLC13 family permease [Paracoccaceae bacterium]